MKTKYPSMFGLLAALLLVVSFVLPTNVMAPQPVEADPGIMKWDAVIAPGGLPLKNDVKGMSDTLDMAVGGDGATILLIVRGFAALGELALVNNPMTPNDYNQLYYSSNGGISFTGSKSLNLLRDKVGGIAAFLGERSYQVAIAPDDPKFWAITCDAPAAPGAGPTDVWVTSDGGNSWDDANVPALIAGETIRTIDISVDYGGKRDIAIGTSLGLNVQPVVNVGRLFVVKSTGFASWTAQNTPFVAGWNYDFHAIKFSPTYMSDAALVAVFADNVSTWYNIWLRDIDTNQTNAVTGFAFTTAPPGIEVRDPLRTAGDSPGLLTLNKADLELPSDFSGQAASLRRAYISLDTWNVGATKATIDRDGIFRMDNDVQYVLMDTSQIPAKSIYSIAYFGTYASGKLLAGEHMGVPCTATVPTWFTDSPTTCPIPCWYPALKPTTGAAGALQATALCLNTQTGFGGALVGWRADGVIAYAATGSLPIQVTAGLLGASTPPTWYRNWGLWVVNPFGWPFVFPEAAPAATTAILAYDNRNDESAFAISRNNGETWNQIDFVDTTLSTFTDVAPTADCKTVYLASNNAGLTCQGFDSVWRSSSNSEVVAPLPGLPIGVFWERVLARPAARVCTDTHTMGILRLVPYCADPSGQIVAWGVYDTASTFANGVAMWSPDYGDYWASVNPRLPIQDFCFESATVMYFLSPGALVQKMPYTGTAWGTTLANVDTILTGAHTIAAYPEGKVLVGASAAAQNVLYATSYSSNFNTATPTFAVMALSGRTRSLGNVHTAFDPKFKDNNTIFIADDGATGSVYRNNVAAQIRWDDGNMMAATNGAIGCPATGTVAAIPHAVGQSGLVLSYTGEALYSAHAICAPDTNSGVDRTIASNAKGDFGPLSGMPKPGIAWDCLNIFVGAIFPNGIVFTLQPSSLKICGCCDINSNSTLYSIDNRGYGATPLPATFRDPLVLVVSDPGRPGGAGMLWAFTDCLAKKGPALITADKTLIGCDPVSGRAQEVNLCWEQLCVADHYDIEIAKSAAFTIKIIDWVAENACTPLLAPADVTQPCAFFPAGGAAMAAATGTTTGGIASAIAAWGNLECGHTYYWRVKVRMSATTQIARSPWSEVRSFTIKAGLPVSTPYYGVQLLSPNNGGLGIPVKPVSFSWSPFKETTKYKFVLAKDAAMTQVVKEADVTTTAFEYDGALEYSSNYFWRVQSVEPAPSDWSATFSFLTEAAPAAAPGPTPAPPTPVWVWVVIALGAILVIVTLVLIFKTRRV